MILAINARAGVEALTRDFGQLQMKQAPYAARWAIDATMRDADQAVRNRMQQRFVASPRGLRWLQNHVKVLGPNSTLGRSLHGKSGADTQLRGYIGIIPPGGISSAGWERYRGSLVAMMERGGATPGPKRFGGSGQSGMSDLGRFPIPIRRPGTPSPYPKAMYPVNLGLSSRTAISGKRAVGGGLRGKRRTYLVPIRNSPGNAMIFQRYGRGKGSDSMPIFWTQRDTRLPARGYFFPTVDAVVQTRLGTHFAAAMQQALWGRGRYGAVARR